MTGEQVTCPLCIAIDGYQCLGWNENSRKTSYSCEVCGNFRVSWEALRDNLEVQSSKLTVPLRAILSYEIQQYSRAERDFPMITNSVVEMLFALKKKLPSPTQQAINAIRYIGDIIMEKSEPILQLQPNFRSTIGSPTELFAHSIVSQLTDRGVVSGFAIGTNDNPYRMQNIDLTLAGWEAYERERQGQVAGNYGFIALKFGDQVLDTFLNEVIKPAVATLGYDLVDMRNVARAGVIDNVMREQIRDAAFVLVDLTHANNGAYWEAGYAEGLGKQVLYLCEGSTFNEVGTHFDTNHCTTVPWLANEPDDFSERLTATLRRTLGLFPT